MRPNLSGDIASEPPDEPGVEDPSRPGQTWDRVWTFCKRRIRTWRVPPHWSPGQWLEEMKAEGAIAALQATLDFDPSLNVPVEAYMYRRAMGRLITRYRKEWHYALHESPSDEIEAFREGGQFQAPVGLREDLRSALDQLAEIDRQLIHYLFWKKLTESEAAKILGVSQQAINKRKKSILLHLNRWMTNH
jgi:RNA polymerase sigma factor (sigma-70 family)